MCVCACVQGKNEIAERERQVRDCDSMKEERERENMCRSNPGRFASCG